MTLRLRASRWHITSSGFAAHIGPGERSLGEQRVTFRKLARISILDDATFQQRPAKHFDPQVTEKWSWIVEAQQPATFPRHARWPLCVSKFRRIGRQKSGRSAPYAKAVVGFPHRSMLPIWGSIDARNWTRRPRRTAGWQPGPHTRDTDARGREPWIVMRRIALRGLKLDLRAELPPGAVASVSLASLPNSSRALRGWPDAARAACAPTTRPKSNRMRVRR